jgi:hypothetical protein
MTGLAPPRCNCANSESGSDVASCFRLLAFRFRSLRSRLVRLELLLFFTEVDHSLGSNAQAAARLHSPPGSDPITLSAVGLLPTTGVPASVENARVAYRRLPPNETLAPPFTLPPPTLALTLTAPGTFPPTLTAPGVTLIVPPEPGAALPSSDTS